MTGYTTDEPIYALATPFSPSALAVVRTSGNDSIALVSSVFKGRLKDRPSNSAVHGWIVDKEGKKVDEIAKERSLRRLLSSAICHAMCVMGKSASPP